MKIEDAIKKHFEEAVSALPVPPVPEFAETRSSSPASSRGTVIFKLALAAAAAAAMIPVLQNPGYSSPLAEKTNTAVSRYEINEKITSGLMDLHKIAKETFLSEE